VRCNLAFPVNASKKRQKDKKQKEKGRRVLVPGRVIGGADATLDSSSARL
jgi:hypothetical protein